MKLSIIVPTYNHEKYIVQALDSILAQNIRYPFEVLVGEDCSTDHTREILKDYEAKHPGIFTIF
ncbi:MAG: glycosyltransferase, partial [Lachnospiraceae bacterium]|nr:glycosyltransferase [Lachnospiraceae bacterium]